MVHVRPGDGCGASACRFPGISCSTAFERSFPDGTTMQHLAHDVRYTIRSLARVPVLSATIVLTVGLGLGATAAMIGAVWGVLVNPLPYADPGSLVWIYTDSPPNKWRFSVVDYRALEADHPTFEAVAAYQSSLVTVTDRAMAERVTAKSVTGSYFPLLGQKPHLGRLFDPSDDAHRDRIAVLTYLYWSRRFGGDPSVLGRSMTVDGADHTIVGVLAAERRTSRAECRVLHGGAVAHAQAEGAVLHDGDRAAEAGRRGQRRQPGAARDQCAAVPDLAIVISGRKGDVGHAGSQGARRRQRRHPTDLRARRGRARPAHRVRERGQSADCPRAAPQPRAGDSRRARCVPHPSSAVRSSSKPACSARRRRWSVSAWLPACCS